jgi:type III pantothenate kinase
MNLIIDVGNTAIKLAVFSNSRLIRKLSVSPDSVSVEIQILLDRYKSINQGIISTVGDSKAVEIQKHLGQINLMKLSYKTKLPFKNLYKTPNTLGVDLGGRRIIKKLLHPNKNTLIIDAGTCITYDFINSRNEYLGGAISPGVNLRYRSMHNLTANLPLLNLERPKQNIGYDTESSIHSGVVNGVLYEIDGVIEEYTSNYEDLTVILTGGDAKFLSKRLKNTIFANSNFLLEGLNYILEFNKS